MSKPGHELELPTTAVGLMIISFEALAAWEQMEVLKRLTELRLRSEDEGLSEAERILASMQRVAELVGKEPVDLTSEDYRAAIRKEIEQGGAGIEPLSRVMRHFGTWRLAKEALVLSGSTPARRIEARFANRRLGRTHHYSEQEMRETMLRCAADLGKAPEIREYKAWRDRELELAKAQGKTLCLPSLGAYRARFSHWWETLAHYLGEDAGE
jgi:nucleotide-binding universal stress UspA family protein